MAEKVAIVKCESYEQAKVSHAVREAVELLGGMKQFASEGSGVLLKPNLLASRDPASGITTHPTIVRVIAELVRSAGARATIADSPGSGIPYTPGSLKRVYEKTGMSKAAEEAGANLNLDTATVEVSYPDGALIKRLEIIRPAMNTDVLINLPKLKTHVFTLFTGAIKNLFGLIPGYSKPGYHAKLHTSQNFSAMLLDIACYVRPKLTIMDAIVAMEGDGPAGGSLKSVGLILAGTDSVALDVVACAVVGIDPLLVPVLADARDRGLWTGNLSDINIVGEDIGKVRVPDFQLPVTRQSAQIDEGASWLSRLLMSPIRSTFTVRPVVNKNGCTACETCVLSCPEEAVSILDGCATIDDDSCIRCYCCHELCPEGAVDLRQSFLGRLITRWSK